MKRISILIIFLMFSYLHIQAQNDYYDAIKIARFNDKNEIADSIFQRFLPYFLDDNQQLNYAMFFKILDPKLQEKAKKNFYGSEEKILGVCNVLESEFTYNKASSKVKSIINVCSNFRTAIQSKKDANDTIQSLKANTTTLTEQLELKIKLLQQNKASLELGRQNMQKIYQAKEQD